jgi:hypothetical protein
VYAKGKLKLMRKAMELAVLCNTTCAIVSARGRAAERGRSRALWPMHRRTGPLEKRLFCKLQRAGHTNHLQRRCDVCAPACGRTTQVMFDGAGKLTQFSTSDMDAILEQYGQAVLEPHERYTPHDVGLPWPRKVAGRVGDPARCPLRQPWVITKLLL